MNGISDEVDAMVKDLGTSPPLSEGMIRRDNFFHTCWMRLKQIHPDAWEDMVKCELYAAGLEIPGEDKKDDDTDKNKEPPTCIL